jgi:hypothetical protein
VRPLLRWISLVAMIAVLAVLGSSRAHQQNFVLFLAIVLGLTIAVVAVYVATASRDDVPPP